MLSPKTTFLKFILCLLPFYSHGMELACDHSLHLSNQAKLEHEANLAYNHFLETNNLPKGNNHEMVLNNNLFLQCNENRRTAVAVFELNIINDLPPISLNEISKASEHFKVYECKNSDNVWTVMFDYSSPELLPSNREQAGYLLVAPLLEDMPLSEQEACPSFLNPEQRKALCPNIKHPELIVMQLNECKTFFESGRLLNVFKIESSFKSSNQSTQAVYILNHLLHLYHASNALQKETLGQKATLQIGRVCDLALHEGFTLGMVVHMDVGLKKIEDINPGDFVLSNDLEKDLHVVCPVTHVSKEVIPSYVEIVLEQGTIPTALGQKFWLENLQKYETAQELIQSPELRAQFPEAILEMRQVNESIEVYKLTVAHHHNFYVTEKQLLAHNFIPMVTVVGVAVPSIVIPVAKGIGAAISGWIGKKIVDSLAPTKRDCEKAWQEYREQLGKQRKYEVDKKRPEKQENKNKPAAEPKESMSAGCPGGPGGPNDPNKNKKYYKKQNNDKKKNNDEKNKKSEDNKLKQISKNTRDKARANFRPLTNKEARAQAQKLNYREVSDPPMKTKAITFVNSKGNYWITPDLNGHKGGCWKGYDRAANRTTWNFDLTKIIGE